ncbi:acetyl-CoA hydrolase/transferase family protein [Clostridium sp. 'White wine YQ']|uniref:acetyl-CoA hydrolase/transferase family protein n=1 Tax=Clostridium sp. 'White wine YQ' TaxID=3027474 RepID=UPI002365701E|nr:acetyl-CoA hydrolase/transferase C-terminal domain-containing protein [Clostridium sp. 'White wine YQ']MDD7794743.1 acetyl-CoA hydrolase/transferase C-terminal domain-containing protein [Clostridium sp. 'White wine YQ']
MNWKEIYESKLVTAEGAVAKIKSNDRVVLGHAVAEPMELVHALVSNKEKYENVELIQMLTLGKGEYLKSEMKPHFKLNSLFVGPCTRNAVKEGEADFTPCFFQNIPKLFRNKYLPVDVALIKVSTPDANGFCSFGVSNDYTKPAAESAALVIAEVNDKMPRSLGDSFIHVSDIDYIIETSYPLPELQLPIIGEVEKAIGRNCASLIDDGSTLQLGIGAIPDAVLLFLKDKKDLGIHSEMISDGVVELVEAGVITNKRKTLHKDKVVITFAMGTKRLYDFLDNNPMVEMYSVDYVNNPTVISQNYKMVCINSALQVDFLGQVVADTIGLKQFSAVGGQVDFVRGADMAKDGKSIIAMPSTASNGKISRIVPILAEGSAVTTSRNDVEYIVTEYGIANLRGKTLKERGQALINIAHPDFRQSLMEEWEKRFNVRKA